MADGKEREKEEQNGHFYGGITRLNESLGELRGYFRNTQVKLWVDSVPSFVRMLLYLMYRPPFKTTPFLLYGMLLHSVILLYTYKVRSSIIIK